MRYEFKYYQVDDHSPRGLAIALINSYQVRGYCEWRMVSDDGVVIAESCGNRWRVSFRVRPVTLLGALAKEIRIIQEDVGDDSSGCSWKTTQGG